jgi:hypothetical protein
MVPSLETAQRWIEANKSNYQNGLLLLLTVILFLGTLSAIKMFYKKGQSWETKQQKIIIDVFFILKSISYT